MWLKILERGKVFVRPAPERSQILHLGCSAPYSLREVYCDGEHEWLPREGLFEHEFYRLSHSWGCNLCSGYISSLKVVRFLREGREILELVVVWIFKLNFFWFILCQFDPLIYRKLASQRSIWLPIPVYVAAIHWSFSSHEGHERSRWGEFLHFFVVCVCVVVGFTTCGSC